VNKRLIFFEDVKLFYRQIKGRLACSFLVCFALTCLVLLSREPLYVAHATFQQRGQQQEEIASLQSFLRTMRVANEESGAACLMQSKRLVGAVCRELGLQMEVRQELKIWKRVQEKVEVVQVRYGGKEKTILIVRPTEEGFEVWSAGGDCLGKGEVNAPFVTEAFSFTLGSLPSKEMTLVLTPLAETIAKHRSRLKIKTSRVDSQVLELTFSHGQKATAEQFLDLLMRTFQEELIAEHDRLAKKQLAFLLEHKEQLARGYDEALEQHVHYFTEALGLEAADQFSRGLEASSSVYEEYKNRLHTLDLDLRRLEEGAVDTDSPFRGMGFSAVQKLYGDASSEKDALRVELQLLAQVKEQLDAPTFEVSALTKVSQDPIILEAAQKSAELSLELLDAKNRSLKEHERIKEAISLQKKFLASHIEKMEQLCQSKLDALTIRVEQLKHSSKALIQKEKILLGDKLQQLREKMQQTLPRQWLLENQLKLKKELTLLIMKEMTELTESKLIDHNLFTVSSKPLDSAEAALDPYSSSLIFFSLGGGCIGLFIVFIVELIRRYPARIPFSASSLEALGAKLVPANDLAPYLLFTKKPLIAFIGSEALCADVHKFLEKTGHVSKQIKTKDLPLHHTQIVDALTDWREQVEFILLEAEEDELVLCLEIADRLVLQVGEKGLFLPSLLQENLRKAVFVPSGKKKNSSDRRSRIFRLPSVRNAP
jgi:hypothetical protein